MKLKKASYKWALRHLISEGDSDIFPRPFEIDAMRFGLQDLLQRVEKIDIEQHAWNGGRRFLIPHKTLSFRRATQLDPLDSLVLAAIVKQFGLKIEKRRSSAAEQRVFSYRFSPQTDGRLYGRNSSWRAFWERSLEKAQRDDVEAVAVVDIADFYNQLNHHTLDNQLHECGIEKSVRTALSHMLYALSDKQSRGLPVGPHTAHILAECSLIPIDRSLLDHGFDFIRYVDDLHFFCCSEEEAELRVEDFANILDRHQRLAIQGAKTEVLPVEEFRQLAERNLTDRPLNEKEDEILKIIQKAGGGDPDPYEPISLEEVDPIGWEMVNSEVVSELIEMYLAQDPISFSRLAWLFRRLTQVGAPGALEVTIKNLDRLTPVLGDVARYIKSATDKVDNPRVLGASIVSALKIKRVNHNEYLTVVLLNLFSQQPALNHLNRLLPLYNSATPAARRELVLAATAAGAGHWITERKGEFGAGADPWLKRALVAASSSLPGEEGKHWIQQIKSHFSPMEHLVAAWAPKKKAYRRKPQKIRLNFSDDADETALNDEEERV